MKLLQCINDSRSPEEHADSVGHVTIYDKEKHVIE